MVSVIASVTVNKHANDVKITLILFILFYYKNENLIAKVMLNKAIHRTTDQTAPLDFFIAVR